MRHSNVVVTASFSADGRRILTASLDKTARLWDAESGKPVGEPIDHEGQVVAASFSANGQRILTASAGKTINISGDGILQVWFVQRVSILTLCGVPTLPPRVCGCRCGCGVATASVGAGADRGVRWAEIKRDGVLVPTTQSIVELRTELLALKGDDFWSRFGRWFFMRGPERTLVPTQRLRLASSSYFGQRLEKGKVPRGINNHDTGISRR